MTYGSKGAAQRIKTMICIVYVGGEETPMHIYRLVVGFYSELEG